jgi:ABC-type nitrate/sulfonate/bicarbonate transport system permease component
LTMSSLRRLYRLALSALSVVAAIVLWDQLSGHMSAPELLPRPGAVLGTLWQMAISGELLLAIRDSVARVLVGYTVGVVAGVVTGLILGAVRALNDTIGVIFDFAKGIPPIALVPVVIIWLGIGETSKYVVIAYIVWIVVAISTAVGAREVPLVRLRAGAFFGLSRRAIFWRIVLPSCLPYVLAGMRSAIGFAFVALVSAELIAANSGIGQIIMDARFALQTSRMIVGLLVLGVLGALAQGLFDAIVARSKIAAHF